MRNALSFPLLHDSLLSASDHAGRSLGMFTLPGLYAALVRGEVRDFPAVRPHQRHVWHAFLVQVAALALLRSERTDLPVDESGWRELLLGLTPEDPDGAAWSLVAPLDRPALLQPPVPEGSLVSFSRVETPDALDMLVTAKNHDVKRTVMVTSRPEHWLYALVSLQTQEGFLGAGNYGISRMNGGFASRPGFGIVPSGGASARLIRDVTALLSLRDRILQECEFYPSSGGLGLVWLSPWDGKTSLALGRLDPFYVEVCRRARLSYNDSAMSLTGLATGTRVARIDAKQLNGRTGDPWTPLKFDAGAYKSLTLDASGLSYRRLVPLLFPVPDDAGAAVRAPLQEWHPEDPGEGMSILARGLVRGQGKTQGVHERRIPLSRVSREFLGPGIPSDRGARIAEQRVADAGLFSRKVLFPAALTVFTAAPSANERARDDDAAKKRANSVVDRFERQVDVGFFEALEAEFQQHGDARAEELVRARWLRHLRELGEQCLEVAMQAAPSAAMRKYRIRVRAERRFARGFRQHFAARLVDDQHSPNDGGNT